MNAKLAIIAVLLAAPSGARPAPAEQQPGPRPTIISPPDDDTVIDDVVGSFHSLFSSSHDRNVSETVMFRIKQGRCKEARQLAMVEGKPDLVAIVDRTCKPKP